MRSFNEVGKFFRSLRMEEKFDRTERRDWVRYSTGERSYVVGPLHYHMERLLDIKSGKIVKREYVLNWRRKHNWPKGRPDNTEEIALEMTRLCKGDKKKEQCRIFLIQLRDKIREALNYGMPRDYWPNLLNNNHWHDVANFVKLCIEQPQKATTLISQAREGSADKYPHNRLRVSAPALGNSRICCVLAG